MVISPVLHRPELSPLHLERHVAYVKYYGDEFLTSIDYVVY